MTRDLSISRGRGRSLLRDVSASVLFGRSLLPSASAFLLLGLVAGCGPQRLAVIGPLAEPMRNASAVEDGTRLDEAVRIDFDWTLNEAGSRIGGQGVARIEPPYRARLDLFLDNGESVVSAAVVDDELRLPYGAPDDVLPPVDLMWGTLGVFRPMAGTRLVGGERLEEEARRLRYRYEDGMELHYEVDPSRLRAVELLEGGRLVQWVRLAQDVGDRYPQTATYRNLVDYRELKIDRRSVREAESFDPAIFDPRE